MKTTAVLTKTLKYLIYFLLLLIVLSLLLVAFVLHTETGSRFAIKQGIGFAAVDVKYDSIQGNLADGLIINNLSYEDQAVELTVKNINYQSNWSWFNRHVELLDASVSTVNLVIKEGSTPTEKEQAFAGIELPLTIDIKHLLVNEFNIVTAAATNTINSIEISAAIETSSAKVRTLKVNSADYKLSTNGAIDFKTGLIYQMETAWQVKQQENTFQGKGQIKGDLAAVELQQDLLVKTDVVEGQFNLAGTVNNLSAAAALELQISAAEAKVLFNEQNLKLLDLQVAASGLVSDYQISLQSTLVQDTLLDGKLPPSQIKLEATGDLSQLDISTATISSEDGVVDLAAQLDWQEQFKLSSQLMIERFNPQQLLPDWPGNISGKLDFNLAQTEQGVVLSIDNNALTGQLKGQEFTLTGSAIYSAVPLAETLTANHLILDLGDNHVEINGQVVQQDVALEVLINWVDLSVLDQQLSGTVEGWVNLSGDYQKPELQAELTAKDLVYADYIIDQLSIESSGHWGESLDSEIIIKKSNLAGNVFNNIQIAQLGWTNQHKVKVLLDADDFSSVLTVTGQLNSNKNKQQIWHGQINKHELVVKKDQRIRLQSPVDLVIATDQISVTQGCWQGVEAGTLCISMNDITQTDSYQGSLTLDAFSLIPLQIFLPPNLEVKGKLQGDAEFVYQNNNIDVSSNLQLNEGELLLKNATATVYQTAIENFNITAKTNQQNVAISLKTTLADNSFLNLDTMLDKNANQDWLIDTTIKGAFNSSQLLQELSAEIEQLEGQITIDGSVVGSLTQPEINLTLNQPDGHLTLARLGTVIEKLKLSVSTQGIDQLIYQIQLSGNNLSSINQGQIASTGKLSMNAAGLWQYRGDLTGNNFMLLDLPEAKFNVSPKLAITADQNSTDIKGELGIDYGHVVVKQLPASSIGNSDDLTIHTEELTTDVAYPITLNVKANIIKPISLDVIGLVAELSGSIQLVQAKDQNLIGKGVLNLNNGSYEIYGQKLEINEGELTFTGPLENPRIKVKASRKSISRNVVAGVDLGGTVNNLQSNLYSEPSMSDIEKLSYIMTGRGIEGSGSLNGEQLKQAAIVMGLNQSSPIFNQIQNQFGIDVLTVRESAKASDTVVEAGKKINDKLYVSYNQGLFNRLGFWVLKYHINQFLDLQTTQGEDQSVNLVYTRKAEVSSQETEKKPSND